MPEIPSHNTAFRYKNLDGLRGILVLYVVMVHIEMYKPDYGFAGLPVTFLLQSGNVAVTVFFALSGFIITHLLLKERAATQRISIRKFYIRRVLRIFPAYFMVLLAGFLLYRELSSTRGVLLSVFFLSNIAYLKYLLPPVLYPIWSVGVEEQFYAIHPFVMKWVTGKNKLLLLFLTAIFIVWILRYLYLIPGLKGEHFFYALHNLFDYSRYDVILMGCIAALYFSGPQQLVPYKWVFKKNTQYFLLLVFAVLLALTAMFGVIFHELYGAVAALIIANLCYPASSVVSLNIKPLVFAGNISYGLYLTHKFVLYAVMHQLAKRPFGNIILQNIVIYAAVITGTVAVAAASYYFYESYFLKLKKRF